MDGSRADAPAPGPLRTLAARVAEEAPEHVAGYRPTGEAVTYQAFQDQVEALGARLPEGARRVALVVPNALEGAAGVHAVWQHGASAVLVSPLVPEDEAVRRVRDTGCDAVLRFDEDGPHVERRPSPARPVPDEAVVVFTSGTTGRPKGAVLSFDGIASSVSSIGQGVGLAGGRLPVDPPRTPTPVFMPLAHVGGFLATVNALYQGKPLVVFEKFRAAEVFDLVERFDLTILRLAPTMVFDLAYWEEVRSLGRVRSVSVGSAPLSEEVRRRFEERYGAYVLQSYGMTEFAGAVAFERYEDAKHGRRRPGTVGRIAPGVEVRIVTADGSDARAGESGEIWASGRSRFVAYLGDGGTITPAPEGWLATGDLGSVDDDGFLTVLGRADDTILCGGFNIYPAVVEAALNRVEGIAESAVVGIPDDRLGEIPVAAVVSEHRGEVDGEALRIALRSELAPYEVPRRIVAVRRIPVTPGRKPDRAAVAALF